MDSKHFSGRALKASKSLESQNSPQTLIILYLFVAISISVQTNVNPMNTFIDRETQSHGCPRAHSPSNESFRTIQKTLNR